MTIKAIRIGKLISGPGFSNHRVELEAEVDVPAGGVNFDDAFDELNGEVDRCLARLQLRDQLVESVQDLQQLVHSLEGQRDRLRGEVAELTTKVVVLENGGKPGDDDLPF